MPFGNDGFNVNKSNLNARHQASELYKRNHTEPKPDIELDLPKGTEEGKKAFKKKMTKKLKRQRFGGLLMTIALAIVLYWVYRKFI